MGYFCILLIRHHKVNNHPMGEISPNPVTLPKARFADTQLNHFTISSLRRCKKNARPSSAAFYDFISLA
jgi:tRNA A22 N-methylase